MSASAQARLLACVAALALGCEAKLLIGRNCAAGECDPAPPGDTAGTCGAELVLPPVVAVANEPFNRCRLFTLDGLHDAAGSDHAFISKAVATMMPYGHEIEVRVASEVPGVPDGPVDCSAILDQPVRWLPLLASSDGSESWGFEGEPLRVTRAQRILIVERFANSSASPIMVAATLRLECASSVPEQPSQTFEFVNADPHVVGPAEQLTVSGSCNFDRKVTVWRLYRPTQRISAFAAYRDHEKEPLWNNADWSFNVSPSLLREDGDSLQWSCEYQNLGDTNFEIGGDSGYSCALMGIYQLEDGGEDEEPLRCTPP